MPSRVEGNVAAALPRPHILFIRGLHMEAIGRSRVSVGIGYMHPEYGWGGVLYEMRLSETVNGWQVDTMTAKLHT